MVTNQEIATTLDGIGDLLEAQGANPFRVRAYHGGAETVRGLEAPVQSILDAEGVAGLMQLPRIGRSLAHAIAHLARSGRLPLFERLQGEDVEQVFATVPDIGLGLAQRIHEELDIETLAELEAAANDGRLAQVPGMGRKRVRAVRESLAGRFAHRRRKQGWIATHEPSVQVDVKELLDIDREYRQLAEQGRLPRIAPRRFNPTQEAWLPILHTTRGDRHYTALFSNTARAHELQMTHDWVVIYRDDHGDHGCWTAITARYGRLRGHRIIRGREHECDTYYRAMKTAGPSSAGKPN